MKDSPTFIWNIVFAEQEFSFDYDEYNEIPLKTKNHLLKQKISSYHPNLIYKRK
jgi:hypothetical protein